MSTSSTSVTTTTCPRCGTQPWGPCVTPSGRITNPHAARVNAALDTATKETP